LFFSWSIYAQERSIYGNVSDPFTNKGIGDISLINTRSGEKVNTNTKGDFYLRAQKGDSIIISTLGYKRKGLKFDGIQRHVSILTKQEAIVLQELIVTEKSTAELNKEIAAYLKDPQNAKTIRKEILSRTLNTNVSQPGIGISIDALYDLFSKEGKAYRKLADLQFEDTKQFYADLKYNKTLVRLITKLEEEDLNIFMKMCKPSQAFILAATDYDMTHKIFECLSEFRYRQIRGTLPALD
jgi:hypothetical protein